ncbi:hypothetical protein [Fuerstiella marisgermanici]|uniref:hypothetical protein n=1 Tax=Fuerstiella marisgermanici TaxID=1891926 RepID=UPI00097C74D5|nr:hypothetical protein [Fuerstiella marisgermanici]
MINDYAEVIAAPQSAIANRKSQTAVLRPLFREVSQHLTKMDRSIPRFRVTSEGDALGNASKEARIIRDLGRGPEATPPVEEP